MICRPRASVLWLKYCGHLPHAGLSPVHQRGRANVVVLGEHPLKYRVSNYLNNSLLHIILKYSPPFSQAALLRLRSLVSVSRWKCICVPQSSATFNFAHFNLSTHHISSRELPNAWNRTPGWSLLTYGPRVTFCASLTMSEHSEHDFALLSRSSQEEYVHQSTGSLCAGYLLSRRS
jgi:hypothetical protein